MSLHCPPPPSIYLNALPLSVQCYLLYPQVMTFDLSVGLDTITCMLYMVPKITPLIDIRGLHWQILDSINMTDSIEENVSFRKINKWCFKRKLLELLFILRWWCLNSPVEPFNKTHHFDSDQSSLFQNLFSSSLHQIFDWSKRCLFKWNMIQNLLTRLG